MIGDLGDEAERALRADHQVLQDVEWIAEIDQRVQTIAGGVLDRVLATDAVGEVGIGARAFAQVAQSCKQRAMRPSESCSTGGIPRVEHTAVGQHDPHAGDGVIAVLRRTTAHAAGVIGGDATDLAGVDRRRVRPDLAAEAGEMAVRFAAEHAWPQPDGGGIGGDVDAAPAVAQHRQHRIGDRLARQAGAGGAEGDRRAMLAACRQQPTDFRLVFHDDDELRNQSVEAGVGAVGKLPQRIADQTGFRKGRSELVVESFVSSAYAPPTSARPMHPCPVISLVQIVKSAGRGHLPPAAVYWP